MIQVDLPVAFGMGSLMAHAAQRQIASGEAGAIARAFNKVLLFHSVAFMWPPLYLMVFYFGFETSHMWWHADSVMAYPWLLPAFFLALLGVHIAGFKLGAKFIRAGHASRALMVFGATSVFCVAWIMLQRDRTLTLGTYQDWLAGTAPAASTDSGFMAFVIALIVGYSAGAWMVYRSLRRES
jgi:hypothetical protein